MRLQNRRHHLVRLAGQYHERFDVLAGFRLTPHSQIAASAKGSPDFSAMASAAEVFT
jgi:hypothetical protein